MRGVLPQAPWLGGVLQHAAWGPGASLRGALFLNSETYDEGAVGCMLRGPLRFDQLSWQVRSSCWSPAAFPELFDIIGGRPLSHSQAASSSGYGHISRPLTPSAEECFVCDSLDTWQESAYTGLQAGGEDCGSDRCQGQQHHAAGWPSCPGSGAHRPAWMLTCRSRQILAHRQKAHTWSLQLSP